jgi:hypothetical protein
LVFDIARTGAKLVHTPTQIVIPGGEFLHCVF